MIKQFWQYVSNRVGRINIIQNNAFPPTYQQQPYKLITHFIHLSIESLICEYIYPKTNLISPKDLLSSTNGPLSSSVSPIALDVPLLGSKEAHLTLLPHYLALLHYTLTEKISTSNVLNATSLISNSQTRQYNIFFFFFIRIFFLYCIFRNAEAYFNRFVNMSDSEYYSIFLHDGSGGKEFVLFYNSIILLCYYD
jgi:hypothetical protein